MFKQISAKEITENPVKLIGEDWMLISAGTKDKSNGMTASWGGIGYIWNMPVAIIMIRPPRYTYEFVENGQNFTLSFFSSEYKKALGIFGSKSGRDTDKIAESGLTPYFTEQGNPAYKEAKLILECRKLYAQDMNERCFIDKTISDKWYDTDPIHKLYIGEIKTVLVKNQ